MQTLNEVRLLGRLGKDPDIRSMQSGDEVCNLSVATSEGWKDKNTGEWKNETEWHKVSVFNQHLITRCKKLSKGDRVCLTGQLKTRTWEQNGEKKYSTEIVLKPFRGDIFTIEKESSPQSQSNQASDPSSQAPAQAMDDLEDEMPF